jgi:hypothetical protein
MRRTEQTDAGAWASLGSFPYIKKGKVMERVEIHADLDRLG